MAADVELSLLSGGGRPGAVVGDALLPWLRQRLTAPPRAPYRATAIAPALEEDLKVGLHRVGAVSGNGLLWSCRTHEVTIRRHGSNSNACTSHCRFPRRCAAMRRTAHLLPVANCCLSPSPIPYTRNAWVLCSEISLCPGPSRHSAYVETAVPLQSVTPLPQSLMQFHNGMLPSILPPISAGPTPATVLAALPGGLDLGRLLSYGILPGDARRFAVSYLRSVLHDNMALEPSVQVGGETTQNTQR